MSTMSTADKEETGLAGVIGTMSCPPENIAVETTMSVGEDSLSVSCCVSACSCTSLLDALVGPDLGHVGKPEMKNVVPTGCGSRPNKHMGSCGKGGLNDVDVEHAVSACDTTDEVGADP